MQMPLKTIQFCISLPSVLFSKRKRKLFYIEFQMQLEKMVCHQNLASPNKDLKGPQGLYYSLEDVSVQYGPISTNTSVLAVRLRCVVCPIHSRRWEWQHQLTAVCTPASHQPPVADRANHEFEGLLFQGQQGHATRSGSSASLLP